jgi:hypothetical protein
MRKRNALVVLTAGTVALGAGFATRHMVIRLPDPAEFTLGMTAGIFGLIKAGGKGLSGVQYLRGVTRRKSRDIERRDGNLEAICVGLVILIAVLLSTELRDAAFAALGAVLVAVGASALKTNHGLGPWAGSISSVAMVGLAVAFLVVGVTHFVQYSSHLGTSEDVEYALAGFLMLSFLFD